MDENTKLFHAYEKHRKISNTIWILSDNEGNVVSSFQGIALLGKRHFRSLFKADNHTTIVDTARMVGYFPCFVNEEDN